MTPRLATGAHEVIDEEPRISAESRRLAPPEDRTRTANAETIPTASTATTASTSAAKTTVMIATMLLGADRVIELNN
jgi:hypothetical protein